MCYKMYLLVTLKPRVTLVLQSCSSTMLHWYWYYPIFCHSSECDLVASSSLNPYSSTITIWSYTIPLFTSIFHSSLACLFFSPKATGTSSSTIFVSLFRSRFTKCFKLQPIALIKVFVFVSHNSLLVSLFPGMPYLLQCGEKLWM